MAEILDGKKIAEELILELKEKRKSIKGDIKLGIVLIGDNPASASYVEQKQKAGTTLGIKVQIFKYVKDISTKKLRSEVGLICRKPNMRGVIVQLPLPKSINTRSVVNAILPSVDVDMLSEKSVGTIYANKNNMLPPTIASILTLFEKYNIDLAGKTVAVVGYGLLVGKPASTILANRGVTILNIQKSTKEREKLLQMADIIITGVGKPNTIMPNMVKEGAVIIDAGFFREEGRVVGDVNSEVYEKCSFYSPVPDGVGVLTVVKLFENLLSIKKAP